MFALMDTPGLLGNGVGLDILSADHDPPNLKWQQQLKRQRNTQNNQR